MVILKKEVSGFRDQNIMGKDRIVIKELNDVEGIQFIQTEEYQIRAELNGNQYDLTFINLLRKPAKFERIIVAKMKIPFAPSTPVYGEGYSMLCQYTGTIENTKVHGIYGDHEFYKLYAPRGYHQVYNMVMFMPDMEETLLFGFASCHRFSGEFWYNEKELLVVLNLEGITLNPGQSIKLETFYVEWGRREEVKQNFAKEICKNHAALQHTEIPSGWCSWLVYGPQLKAEHIYGIMDAIKEKEMDLKYIQIDDGYQEHMGDWLTESNRFGESIKKICHDIKVKGFEPAIWVAPFIAEKESDLWKLHPDWFVKDRQGNPLSSDQVSYGGWRQGPWYMLDATNPQVREHLKMVFQTMRQEWGVKYFKLDANMWGAMPFGYRYDENKTSVEAYRMGMKAILEGAGKDSFLLGCNAPMWPSMGTVHGMRVTNDNSRRFDRFKSLAQECFFRNWQHRKLWINDPDTILLLNGKKVVCDPNGKKTPISSQLTANEFLFQAVYQLASGGMLLSGDDVANYTKEHCKIINKILSSGHKAAVFVDKDYSIGWIDEDSQTILCLFNSNEEEKEYIVDFHASVLLEDFWTGKEVETTGSDCYVLKLSPHSADAFYVRPIERNNNADIVFDSNKNA